LTSSPEPLGQYQPDLAQVILEERAFKFVQMEGIALLQREIIAKEWKCTENFMKIFFSRNSRPNSIKLVTNYPWVKGIHAR
jgi:hypothetical protein